MYGVVEMGIFPHLGAPAVSAVLKRIKRDRIHADLTPYTFIHLQYLSPKLIVSLLIRWMLDASRSCMGFWVVEHGTVLTLQTHAKRDENVEKLGTMYSEAKQFQV